MIWKIYFNVQTECNRSLGNNQRFQAHCIQCNEYHMKHSITFHRLWIICSEKLSLFYCCCKMERATVVIQTEHIAFSHVSILTPFSMCLDDYSLFNTEIIKAISSWSCWSFLILNELSALLVSENCLWHRLAVLAFFQPSMIGSMM